MSVRILYGTEVKLPEDSGSLTSVLIISPIAMPAVGRVIGTPPSIIARVLAHTDAIEVEPLLAVDSLTKRMVYGKVSTGGRVPRRAFSAKAPWPIERLLLPPIRPTSPVEKGGKL